MLSSNEIKANNKKSNNKNNNNNINNGSIHLPVLLPNTLKNNTIKKEIPDTSNSTKNSINNNNNNKIPDSDGKSNSYQVNQFILYKKKGLLIPVQKQEKKVYKKGPQNSNDSKTASRREADRLRKAKSRSNKANAVFEASRERVKRHVKNKYKSININDMPDLSNLPRRQPCHDWDIFYHISPYEDPLTIDLFDRYYNSGIVWPKFVQEIMKFISNQSTILKAVRSSSSAKYNKWLSELKEKEEEIKLLFEAKIYYHEKRETDYKQAWAKFCELNKATKDDIDTYYLRLEGLEKNVAKSHRMAEEFWRDNGIYFDLKTVSSILGQSINDKKLTFNSNEKNLNYNKITKDSNKNCLKLLEPKTEANQMVHPSLSINPSPTVLNSVLAQLNDHICDTNDFMNNINLNNIINQSDSPLPNKDNNSVNENENNHTNSLNNSNNSTGKIMNISNNNDNSYSGTNYNNNSCNTTNNNPITSTTTINTLSITSSDNTANINTTVPINTTNDNDIENNDNIDNISIINNFINNINQRNKKKKNSNKNIYNYQNNNKDNIYNNVNNDYNNCNEVDNNNSNSNNDDNDNDNSNYNNNNNNNNNNNGSVDYNYDENSNNNYEDNKGNYYCDYSHSANNSNNSTNNNNNYNDINYDNNNHGNNNNFDLNNNSNNQNNGSLSRNSNVRPLPLPPLKDLSSSPSFNHSEISLFSLTPNSNSNHDTNSYSHHQNSLSQYSLCQSQSNTSSPSYNSSAFNVPKDLEYSNDYMKSESQYQSREEHSSFPSKVSDLINSKSDDEYPSRYQMNSNYQSNDSTIYERSNSDLSSRQPENDSNPSTYLTPKRSQEEMASSDFNNNNSLSRQSSYESYQPPNKKVNYNNDISCYQNQEKLLPSPSSSRSSQEYTPYTGDSEEVENGKVKKDQCNNKSFLEPLEPSMFYD